MSRRYQRGLLVAPHLFELRFASSQGDAQAAFALRRAIRLAPDRDVGLYLAVVAADAPKRAVERVLGISRSDLRRRLRTIEDHRDDPAFDSRLGRIEEAMADAA